MFPHMLSHDFVHQLGDHIIKGLFCLEFFLILTIKEFDPVILSNLISSRTFCDIKCAQFFFKPNLNMSEWLILFHTKRY